MRALQPKKVKKIMKKFQSNFEDLYDKAQLDQPYEGTFKKFNAEIWNDKNCLK